MPDDLSHLPEREEYAVGLNADALCLSRHLREKHGWTINAVECAVMLQAAGKLGLVTALRASEPGPRPSVQSLAHSLASDGRFMDALTGYGDGDLPARDAATLIADSVHALLDTPPDERAIEAGGKALHHLLGDSDHEDWSPTCMSYDFMREAAKAVLEAARKGQP